MIFLKKKIGLYWTFTKIRIQILLSYRINSLVFVFGGILKTFVIYYLWKAVFKNSSNHMIHGFNSNDMIIYIFISSITTSFIGNNIDAVIGNEVKDGSIAINLIKPINYHLRMLADSLGGIIYQTSFVAIPLWVGLVVVRYNQVKELPPDIGTIVVYILSLFLAFLILFLFNFSFGVMAFYVTNLWGISNLKNILLSFFSGGIIPIVFLPLWLQNPLKFVPFASMNYVPVMIYLKKITGRELLQALGTQMFWIFFLLAVSIWMWNKAIKRLAILGG